MNRGQAGKRVEKLRELINDYRYNYHVLNKSIISEEAADSLKHELSQLETQYPDLVTADSPTQRVAGAALPGFKSVIHQSRMLSLNDTFSEAEIRAWQERVLKALPAGTKLTYLVDIKMDGLACSLVYQDGLLVQGVTRGDGFAGEDVTANIRTLESIPLRLRQTKDNQAFLTGRTEVRGEIVMYKEDFARLNDKRQAAGQALFANPRNTAAGTIRQLDPKLVADRPLHFRAYDLIRDDPSEVPTFGAAYQTLKSLGFLVNSQAKVLSSIEEVIEFMKVWEESRTKLQFNTDGLVVKVDERRLYSDLGVAGKAPRGAIAIKYAAEEATTKVKDIFVSIGRTGVATPVAMLEPVVVAGSTVQMATLHNQNEVHRKDIRVGDTVIIHKAGDVIPEVVEPIKRLRTGQEKPFVMPESCPECGTKLMKYQPQDAAWRCPNNACPSRTWKRIEHYASKSALDIDSLGEKNVIALIEAGLIKDPSDIYKLKVEDLLPLERFAEVSATKLVKGIADKKRPALNRFIYGLGIRHIGEQTAVDLANHFKSLARLSQATIDELSQVEGVGEIVAESVVGWFSLKSNQQLLDKFKDLGVWPDEVKSIGSKLQDKSFVVTGTLESMGREEAAEKIRALGGTFQSSVGKDTDYLVVGANGGANKLAEASRLGTKQLNEEQFIKILS